MPVKKGRPKIEFDLEEVEKLGRLQCTYSEVAAFFNCSTETVERRMKDTPAFSAAFIKGLEGGRISLRRAQWQSALGGNITMQIWLGKQYLGQRDKSDLEHQGEMRIVVETVND